MSSKLSSLLLFQYYKMESSQLRKTRSVADSSIFHCKHCTDIVVKPKQCFGCGSLFCQQCINYLISTGVNCPEGCDRSNIKDIGAGLRRIYNQIDIKCSFYEICKRTLKVNQIEAHQEICQAPACKMKELCGNNIVKNRRFDDTFCSAECYLLDLVKSTDDDKLLYTTINSIISMPEEESILEWDPYNKASFIKAVGNRILTENAPVFAFISAITKTAFNEGEHYWEIKDSANQSLLKVGVTTTTKINYNIGFSDVPTGYAYYALGQLRNGSDSKGQTYGPKHATGTPIGIYLNMDKGILGFVINGQYQGPAFTTPELSRGPIYPAVSFLKGVDCTIVEKKVPPMVKMWN